MKCGNIISLFFFCFIFLNIHAQAVAQHSIVAGDGTTTTPTTVLETDTFTGAAIHKIPIEVPPGRAGIEPDISFT